MNALPPTGKADLADYLEKLASTMRDQAQAELKRAQSRDANRRRRSKISGARDMLKGYLWQGIDPARAALMVEQQTGIEAPALHKMIFAMNDEIQRAKRNRQIMQKAALGWTNAALAEHFGLAEKSIARIIAQMRKEA